jgi:hypothetical protein
VPLSRGPAAAAGAQQREAAQGDASQDGRAARELHRAGRVAEDDDARYRPDERLQVEEGPGDLGGHLALRVGEQRERQQRSARRQAGDGQHDARAGREGGHAFRGHRERQRGERRPQELHRGQRDRVAALQPPGLRHRERGRQQQRRQHQAVAGGCCAAPASARDQADAGQRHREAHPGHRARHRPVPERRDDRDQHRGGADQQRRVADAGAGDAGVLHHDRPAVPDRARGQHGGRAGGTHLGAGGHGKQDRGGQAETHEGEPAGRQPAQGQLGQRHCRAPQHPGGGERGDGAAAIGVHVSILTGSRHRI